MKKLLNTVMLFTCSLVLISASCKKEKIGIEALPPATQTGEQTFGCLINGVAFTPKGTLSGGPFLDCYYQYANTSTLKGFYFGVFAANYKSDPKSAIYIQTDSLEIEKGKIFNLGLPYTAGKASGWFSEGIDNNYLVQDGLTGELKITHLDYNNQIVSGTFWFDAINDKGEKIEVREGRFDMRFTK